MEKEINFLDFSSKVLFYRETSHTGSQNFYTTILNTMLETTGSSLIFSLRGLRCSPPVIEMIELFQRI